MAAVLAVPLCLAAVTGCGSMICKDSAICGDGNKGNDLRSGGGGNAGGREPRPGAESPSDGLEPGDDLGREPRTTPGTVRFSGEVLITAEIDLDSDPPGHSDASNPLVSGGTDLYYFPLSMTGISSMVTTAEWKDDRTPTRAECDDSLVRYAVTGAVDMWSEVGTSLCVRTSEGRTAFVHLRERAETGYMLDVVTWEKDR
ncbi:hypothetical protein [Streptomyces macrosporus]|uniref:hypothetical protein n=1 Tax=Streptomyces macrosporus TaxID=44032 RepID=UPI0031E4811A